MLFSDFYRMSLHARTRDNLHAKTMRLGAVQLHKRMYKFTNPDFKDEGTLVKFLQEREREVMLYQKRREETLHAEEEHEKDIKHTKRLWNTLTKKKR